MTNLQGHLTLVVMQYSALGLLELEQLLITVMRSLSVITMHLRLAVRSLSEAIPAHNQALIMDLVKLGLTQQEELGQQQRAHTLPILLTKPIPVSTVTLMALVLLETRATAQLAPATVQVPALHLAQQTKAPWGETPRSGLELELELEPLALV